MPNWREQSRIATRRAMDQRIDEAIQAMDALIHMKQTEKLTTKYLSSLLHTQGVSEQQSPHYARIAAQVYRIAQLNMLEHRAEHKELGQWHGEERRKPTVEANQQKGDHESHTTTRSVPIRKEH